MKFKAIVVTLLALTLVDSRASPKCPLPFLSPTLEYGQLGARKLLEANFSHEDEDMVFEYIESGSSATNKKYGTTYRVQIFNSELDPSVHRVALEWILNASNDGKSGNLQSLDRRLPDELYRRIVAAVKPIILRTHYAQEQTSIGCLDGFVAQVSLNVGNSDYWGPLGGEAYTPPVKSEAGAVVELGRGLRQFADKSNDEDAVKILLYSVEKYSRSAN